MTDTENGLTDIAREQLRKLEAQDYFEMESEKEARRMRKNGTARKGKGRKRGGFRDEAEDAFDGQDW